MHFPSEAFQRTFSVAYTHCVYFTRALFSLENLLLAQLFSSIESKETAKALVVIDQGVAQAFPHLTYQVIAYFSQPSCSARLVLSPLVLPGGEAAKNDPKLVQEILRQIELGGICRHSYLVAIGGGAFLDAAGFAAGTAHRGVRLIRLPTTTLSQADGGIGVKNGINAFGKKNFIGAFSVPYAVINDFDFWANLPMSEKRTGLIEAVKVALIRDASFFEEMESMAGRLAAGENGPMERVIQRCAQLHFQHITESGDPFELGSARPLDFGHWAAHKLEQMSHFALSHGAAVALGLALDTIYSHKSGLLAEKSMERVLVLLGQLGFTLFDPLMQKKNGEGNDVLIEGLQEFREHLGGQLTVTLLEEIGRGVEVHEMDLDIVRECISEMAARFDLQSVSH